MALGQRFETVAFEPKLISTLNSKGREPFLVFSGLGCKEYEINRSVYIHSPSDSSMESGEMGARYSQPGKYYDYMTGRLVETCAHVGPSGQLQLLPQPALPPVLKQCCPALAQREAG